MLKRVLFAVAILALLTGCPPDDGSVPPTFPIDSTPPPYGVGAPPLVPDGREVVRVCVLLPSTGASKDVGAEMRRGMAIAQAEIAAQPWRTRAIEWVEQDTKSSEAGAVAAYQRCFAEGFPLIVGPIHPAATTALLPVAAAHDAVLVLPSIGAAVPTTWGEQIIAVGPASADMGRVAAKDAAEGRQLRKAAILHPPGIFGTNLRDTFIPPFETAGGEIVMARELDPSQPQAWRSAALEAGLQGATALFVVCPPEVAAEVLAAGLDEGLVGALDDALAADVDP